jgi:hypothetical protein
MKTEQVVHILLLALSVLNDVTVTWKFNLNETNENNRKEGSESKRTRYSTITDSPGEITD